LPLQAGALLLLALFQLHLVRRALETRLLLRYSRDDVMHGIAYVFGMRYVGAALVELTRNEQFTEFHSVAAAIHAARGACEIRVVPLYLLKPALQLVQHHVRRVLCDAAEVWACCAVLWFAVAGAAIMQLCRCHCCLQPGLSSSSGCSYHSSQVWQQHKLWIACRSTSQHCTAI
jgi:hypothetical protein